MTFPNVHLETINLEDLLREISKKVVFYENETIAKKLTTDDLLKVLPKLDQNELFVLANRYAEKKLSYAKIGKLLHLSHTRAYYIEANSLNKLKNFLLQNLGYLKVEYLDLPTRIKYTLLRYDIYTFEDFIHITKSQLQQMKGISVKSIEKVCKLREELGYPLY